MAADPMADEVAAHRPATTDGPYEWQSPGQYCRQDGEPWPCLVRRQADEVARLRKAERLATLVVERDALISEIPIPEEWPSAERMREHREKSVRLRAEFMDAFRAWRAELAHADAAGRSAIESANGPSPTD